MRKKATVGFASLIGLLVVCFFFSGTIKTLTTPRVMIAQPKWGRLKEEIPLIGYLSFSETIEVNLPDMPEGVMLAITKINVAPGVYVQEGDVLIEMQITGAQEMISVQEAVYTNALLEWLELEKMKGGLRLHRNDESWLAAYDSLVEAYAVRHTSQIALEVEARVQGVELENRHLPDRVKDEILLTLQAAVDTADREVQNALAKMEKANRFGIADEDYQYVMRRRELEDQMYQAEQQIVTLRMLEKSGSRICATQNGYIINVHAKVGQSSNDRSVVLSMSTSDAEIVLRANLTSMARVIEVGDIVNIQSRYGSSVKTTVCSTGYDMYGNPYIDATLQQRDIEALDAVDNLIHNGITMLINYTADSLAYLLPASAVRHSGGQNYVYVLKTVENDFGQLALIVEKQLVDVTDESGDTVAMTGISDQVKVAYMEDRAIGPGSEVMPYD